MGLNDAGEMLEAAKAECVRLEGALAVAEGERDRARATAVRLEQELDQAGLRIDRVLFGGTQDDVLVEARRTKWICE